VGPGGCGGRGHEKRHVRVHSERDKAPAPRPTWFPKHPLDIERVAFVGSIKNQGARIHDMDIIVVGRFRIPQMTAGSCCCRRRSSCRACSNVRSCRRCRR
jgi:hypothetical protein